MDNHKILEKIIYEMRFVIQKIMKIKIQPRLKERKEEKRKGNGAKESKKKQKKLRKLTNQATEWLLIWIKKRRKIKK